MVFGLSPFAGFSWPVRILIWIVLVFLGLFVARFLVALSTEVRNDDEESLTENLIDAGDATGRWMVLLILGITGVFVSGLASAGEVLDMITQLIAQHPFAVSNVGIAGLGGFVVSGLLSLSTTQYAGIVLGIIGAVMLVTEVRT